MVSIDRVFVDQLPSDVFVRYVPRKTFSILSVGDTAVIFPVSIFFREYHFIFGPALSFACWPASTRMMSGRRFSVRDLSVRSKMSA